jgi:hypothetical protein
MKQDTMEVSGKGKSHRAVTPKKAKKAKGGTGKPEIVTPAESVAIAAEFAVKFQPTTEPWIIRTKSGAVRLVDKPIYAALLLAGRKAYPIGDRDAVKKSMQSVRKNWSALSAEEKQSNIDKATATWRPMRKEYHAVVNPLLKAASADKRFTQERYGVSLTKAGIVHVSSRMTHRPAIAAK